jgi:excisionase family DNA binding protein
MQISPLQQQDHKREGSVVEWLTLEEAAKELGKSVAMVRVYVKNETVKSKREKGAKGHEVIMVHAGSLMRLQTKVPALGFPETTGNRISVQRETGSALANPSLPLPASGHLDLDKNGDFKDSRWLRSIGRNESQLLGPSPNAFLTLDEASVYIQLPKSHLERLIKTSMLRFHDVGPRPGGRYRVTRQDLDKL